MMFLEKMQEEHDLFFDDHESYQKLVTSVSDMFSLKNGEKLLDTLPPEVSDGELHTNGIVVFGLNPGYGEFNADNPRHDRWNKSRVADARIFLTDAPHWTSPYYEHFWRFLSSLTQTKLGKWDFFHNQFTALNMIPYASKGISLPARFNPEQFAYIKKRFEMLIVHAITKNPRLLIFNGNPWYRFLIDGKIVKDFEKVEVTPKFDLYFFKVGNTNAILFSKFFTSHFFGLTDKHRTEIIPELIKEREN